MRPASKRQRPGLGSHPFVTRGRAASPLLVASVALLLAAAPASGATVTVRMDNGYDFHPATKQIARGDTVKWKNTSAFEDHDVRGTAPNGYFKSPGGEGGIEPGETYQRQFKQAGSFPYVCLNHSSEGMTGTIVVPMGGSKVDGGQRFRLTVASQTLPASSNFRNVIWVDSPSGGWTIFKTTRKAVVYFTPAAAGQYKFRSEVKRLSDGMTSDYSPIKTLTY